MVGSKGASLRSDGDISGFQGSEPGTLSHYLSPQAVANCTAQGGPDAPAIGTNTLADGWTLEERFFPDLQSVIMIK